jgi:hypothetical protein
MQQGTQLAVRVGDNVKLRIGRTGVGDELTRPLRDALPITPTRL